MIFTIKILINFLKLLEFLFKTRIFHIFALYFSKSFLVKSGGIYEIVLTKSFIFTALILFLSTVYKADVLSYLKGFIHTSLITFVI